MVYDLNGREADEAGIILDALPELEQYIFCSSAGVYKKSDEMPHREVDEGDPKSRHKVGFPRGVAILGNDEPIWCCIIISVLSRTALG